MPSGFEWRPSRIQVATLLVLAAAAAFSVLMSDLPPIAARTLAPAVLSWGAWRAWRESRRPRCTIAIPADAARARVDGEPVDDLSVRWRGPLAFVQWRDGDGHTRRRAFWPDTLPAARRRELRLAAPPAVPARAPTSVAP